jgi:hypothetical protein
MNIERTLTKPLLNKSVSAARAFAVEQHAGEGQNIFVEVYYDKMCDNASSFRISLKDLALGDEQFDFFVIHLLFLGVWSGQVGEPRVQDANVTFYDVRNSDSSRHPIDWLPLSYVGDKLRDERYLGTSMSTCNMHDFVVPRRIIWDTLTGKLSDYCAGVIDHLYVNGPVGLEDLLCHCALGDVSIGHLDLQRELCERLFKAAKSVGDEDGLREIRRQAKCLDLNL